METIAQVVTMKTLIPALLAVLFLAGCAVNKPLPVEAVKLAGMEFYPVYDISFYGLKCNSFSSVYKVNTVCLAHDQYSSWKFYDGELAFNKNRQEFLDNLKKGFQEGSGGKSIDSGNPDILINELKDGRYIAIKFDDNTGYVTIARYHGKRYKQAIPLIDQILADLKDYSPRLGGKQ